MQYNSISPTSTMRNYKIYFFISFAIEMCGRRKAVYLIDDYIRNNTSFVSVFLSTLGQMTWLLLCCLLSASANLMYSANAVVG